MDRASHFYAPGASYGPGGVPVARELAIDRLNVNIADATARLRGRRHRLLRWREAEGWYARALAEAAGNDMARLRLAYVRSQLDEERDAALGFPWLVNPANRVAPGVRYLAHLFSARAAEEEGTASLERAIAHYEQAIRIRPKNQAAYIGLSLLRFDSDRAEAVTRPTDELVDPWFNYDMQFAFEAAILRERRYLEVRAGASSPAGESQ
jgi:tetratricopeptide (TPR) repeat protein